MEAPEKIYLQQNTTTDCYEEWWPEWFEARAKDTDIEYARTDAFIEKACKWLENHNDYQRVLDNGRGVRFDMTQCVIDFRKAMKEK